MKLMEMMAELFKAKKTAKPFNYMSWHGWRAPPVVLARIKALVRGDGSPVIHHVMAGDRRQVYLYKGRDAKAEAARIDMIERPEYYKLSEQQVEGLKNGT